MKDKRLPNLIGLSAKMCGGKDEVYRIINDLCREHGLIDQPRENYYENKKFAGKLKQMASLLTGYPASLFEDQDFKRRPMSPEWDYNGHQMTYRRLLQVLGTEAIRDTIHPNAWVNALFADFDYSKNWIVTDVRFPNEAKAIKEHGGVLIRINRKGYEGHDQHSTETALDDYQDWDIVIENNKDLTHLRNIVEGYFNGEFVTFSFIGE